MSWRVHGMRRLLKLQARQLYGLQPDAVALQEKLDGPTYDVTIRVVVVAPSAEQASVAQAELAELAAVLGQYAARSGNRVQRLVRVGGGQLIVPEPLAPLPWPALLRFVQRWRGVGATTAFPRPFSADGPFVRRVALLPAPPLTAQTVSANGRRQRMAAIGRSASIAFVASLAAAPGFLAFGWLGVALRELGERLPAAWHLALPFAPAQALPTALAVAGALLKAHLVLLVVYRRNGTLAETRLARLRARRPRPHSARQVLMPFSLWAGPSILSADELGGLWHLPSARQEHLVRWLPCRVLPAPPHAFVGADAGRLVIGHARRSDGTLAPVGPTLRDLRQILHLTAGMGAGKSRLLANLIQQLFTYSEDGVRPNGLLVLDGKGDDDQGSLVAVVRRLLPLEAEARLVLLDPLDTEWPIGVNPLQGIDLSRPGGADMALGQILAIFGRLDPETWNKAMGMQQYVRMAALLVLEAEAHPTLAHVKQALLDKRYREQLLPRCTNIDVTTFWQITFPQVGEMQRTSLDALLRRFDNLLTTETTRYLLTQPRSTIDFGQAMDEGRIVLMPMPDMTLGGMANLIGMLMFQAIVRAAFGRAGSDQTRLTCPLIADEFQVFIGTGDVADLRTALTRLRSLGIAGVYAHQSLVQLGDLRDEMLINAASRVMLQTLEPDASLYARQYAASGLKATDIAGQDPDEHQYVTLRCGGHSTGVCSVAPLPWPRAEPPALPAYMGTDWQTVRPAEVEPADDVLVELIYGFDSAFDHQMRAAMVIDLAQMPEAEWVYVLERWATIRAAQRAHILANPGSVPDQLERQRWLSRLWAATPRLLAAAQYQRQRRAIEPDAAPEPRDGRRGRQARGGESVPGQREWRAAPGHKTSAHFGVDGGPPEEPGSSQPGRPPRETRPPASSPTEQPSGPQTPRPLLSGDDARQTPDDLNEEVGE
jgi:membrane protease YdiL (CAAX protease family)